MTLDDAARYAPIVTATVALLALITALISIYVQRGVARRRAAIDLFMRTEMDPAMLEAYDKYETALKSLSEAKSMEDFSKTDSYTYIRRYMDIQELIAVGIHTRILDEKVCFEFHADDFMDACEDCARVIEFVRAKPDGTFSYIDLLKLNKRWHKKNEKLLRRKAPRSSRAS